MKTLIAMCPKLEQLKPSNYNANEIRIDIGVLEEGKESPRNFRRDSDTEKLTAGGMFARIFASSCGSGTNANIFSYYGPEISYGQQEDYEHAARACKAVRTRLNKFNESRGYSTDAAEDMGRFLEAAGINRVFLRPDKNSETWLDRGEWIELTPGEFVNRVRRYLHVAAQAAA